jgi:hypothetical protein
MLSWLAIFQMRIFFVFPPKGIVITPLAGIEPPVWHSKFRTQNQGHVSTSVDHLEIGGRSTARSYYNAELFRNLV